MSDRIDSGGLMKGAAGVAGVAAVLVSLGLLAGHARPARLVAPVPVASDRIAAAERDAAEEDPDWAEPVPDDAAAEARAARSWRSDSAAGFADYLAYGGAAADPDAPDNGSPGVSPFPSTPGQPGQDAGSGDPGPAVPGGDGPGGVRPPATPEAVLVSGVVTHEVWGSPVRGAHVRIVGEGADAWTGADGSFVLRSDSGRSPGSLLVALDLGGSSLMSHGAAQTHASSLGAHSGWVSFSVYLASEARGTDQSGAGFWKNWDSHYSWSAMDVLTGKVGHASAVWGGVEPGDVREAMSRKKATDAERAEAALLGLWLNLASGKLGFDTTVEVSSVRGWRAAVPSADSGGRTTALKLARDAEAAYTAASADAKTIAACCSPNVRD